MNPKNFSFTVLILLLTISAQAQFSLRLTEPHTLLKQSMAHYEEGHFTQSKILAQQYIDKKWIQPQRTSQCTEDALFLETALFYKNLSSVGLKEIGAMADLAIFLANTPFASIQQYGYFKMAKILFAQQSFALAIPYYEKSNINYLSNSEITERNFELAYCYLLNNQLDKVKPLFASIKDVEGTYFSPGNYYHGVLSYYSGDYDAALKSFELVKKQKEYQNIVPFYIAELNYFKGNKDEALRLALEYLKDPNAEYFNEMSQLAGQIYYEKGKFTESQNYLGSYVDKQKNVRNDDFFRIGFVKYQMGDLPEAISYFKQVKNNGTDLFSQALYYLGLSYLKNGDKKSALDAFRLALKANKLGKLTEDVSFNAAKLSYDLEGTEESEKELENFVKQYPTSQYYGDAMEMLALLNIKTKNFEKSIQALNKLGTLSPVFQSAYQKVNYARGIQLLMNDASDLAIPFFTESEKYPVNDNLVGLAEFWKAECYYRSGQYSDALATSKRFIEKPGEGNSQALVKSAYLTNAYVFMHQNDKEKLKQAYANYIDTVNDISAAMALGEMDSIKPNYVPSHIPYVEANPYVFIYQLPSQQFDFVYTPMPLTPLPYSNISDASIQRENYFKLGIGNIGTTLFNAGYNLKQDVNSDMYLSLAHRASNSSTFLQQASTNSAQITSVNNLGDFNLNSALTLARDVYRPYGAQIVESSIDDLKNRFFNASILTKINPVVEHFKGVNYNATVGFGLYNINNQVSPWKGSELSFLLDVPFSKKINETTDVSLGLETQVNGLVGGASKVADEISTGSSFLVVKPSMHKDLDGIDINVGLFPAFGKNIHLLPNISLSRKIDMLKATGGIGVESELLANSYKQLTQINPYISLVDLQQTKRTLYFAQIAGSIYDNFNYSFKIGAGSIKNLPLFINDTIANRGFDVWYEENANVVSARANVEYHLNYKTNAGAQLHVEPLLNTKTYSEAYHYVPFRMNIYAKYSYNNKLDLRADLFLRSGTKALAPEAIGQYNVKGAADLNLQANYRITNKWTAFAELNNLLNNRYQRWYNYPNYGFNFLGGISYSFNQSLSALKKNTVLK